MRAFVACRAVVTCSGIASVFVWLLAGLPLCAVAVFVGPGQRCLLIGSGLGGSMG